jgi:hypothetical protein
MRLICTLLAAALAAAVPALPQSGPSPFEGRWDLTVTRGNVTFPSWMEVVMKDSGPMVRAQQRTGNVAPVAGAKIEGGRLIVTVSSAQPARPAEGNRPAAPARPELIWEFTAAGGKISGTSKQGASEYQLAGVRAPALKRAAPKAWTNPEPLFNGKDLTGWKPINNTAADPSAAFESYWTVENGELTNKNKGPNIRTVRTFDDFKLHIEYFCPQEENSGIYLRGRYEAQVAPPPPPPGSRPAPAPERKGPPRTGPAPYRNPYGGVGCIYGMLGPATPPSFKPDWQVYDITLIGRWVTVAFNGVTTIDNQEIAGITGGALDSNEGEPGPIYFQGDHHGGIRYRNITIQLPKR